MIFRTMFFQQWTGVNAILYYAPSIFASLGLTGNTISLLATGVVGVVYVLTPTSMQITDMTLLVCSLQPSLLLYGSIRLAVSQS